MSKPLFTTDLRPKNIARRDFVLGVMEKHEVSGRFLEVGCGNGKYGRLLHDHVDMYVGVDMEAEYLAAAVEGKSSNEHYLFGNGEVLPFNGPFDVVLFGRSFHYSDDSKTLLREAKRVLDPSGIVIVVEPNEEGAEWNLPELQPDHKDFDPRKYRRKIENIKLARAFLAVQSIMEVCSFEEGKSTNSYRWVLKH
ncbi:MAG: class I SAM-dependent methyltransferase [Candidatus Nanoarchaeia archaeon]